MAGRMELFSFPSRRLNPQRQQWTRWLLAAAKLAVFAVLCWFIYRALVSANEQLNGRTWHVEPGWLVLSGALYLLGLFPAALFWHRVLLQTGQQVALGESLRAYYISQLGKYVPGKWMVILLRRTLLRGPAVENTVVAASVFFETLSMLAVGSAMAALVLIIWHRHQPLLIAAAVGSMLLLGLPTIPVLFQWLMRVLGIGKLNPTAGARFSRIGWRTLLVAWLAMAVGWLVQGMSLWATLRGMQATAAGPLEDLWLHTTTVSLSIVAGFLSQIPAGLAVREWISSEFLEPQYGPGVAIISAIIFRFVLLVSELLISIILYAAGWRRPVRPAVEPELTASSNH